MSGKIEWIGIAISLLAAFAIFTDLLWGKIYNWITITGLVLGVVYSTSTSGWDGFGHALFAALVGFVLYGWMFYLRFMGGGDVKLLMAFGAWGGVHFVEEVAILGIALGGVLALLVLLFKGRLITFSKKLYRFLLSAFVKELELQFPTIDRRLTMPFGVSLSIAAVWTYWGHPLIKGGLILWP